MRKPVQWLKAGDYLPECYALKRRLRQRPYQYLWSIQPKTAVENF